MAAAGPAASVASAGAGDSESEVALVSDAPDVTVDGPAISGAPPVLSGAPPVPAPAFADRYFPFLADEHEQGSISVGDTSYGYLVGARRIEEGASLGILPRQRARNLNYGADQLVQLLEDAGRRFQGRTKTRFWIGNIARRTGGDIPYSVSHNSGRDADVALAYTDALGAPADPPDLLAVDAYGTTRDKEHKYRFDAPRTWQVIKSLLESDRAQIEFLFLARGLTERVLKHAQEKKEPQALIERATSVLLQPGGAPHDDHLHVRVYCSERDVEGGCLNAGPVRSGVRLHMAARARRIERSIAALASEAPEQRARGIERLVLLQAQDHKDDIGAKLGDAEGRVRAAAATALGQWGGGDDAARIAKRLGDEAEPMARAAMMEALSGLGGPAAGDFFAGALGRAGTLPWGRVAEAATQPGSPTPFLILAEALSPLPFLAPHIGFFEGGADEPAFAMKLYIIDAAGFCDRAEPVAPLFTLLADTDPSVRAHAAQALARLLNRPLDPRFQDPAAPSDVVMRAALDLNQQAAPLRRGDRSSWMVEGFSRAGFKVPQIAPENAWEILRAFGAGEPYSYNAGRALARIALGNAEIQDGKRRPPRPPVFEETLAECRYWLKWLEGHRGKLHLPKAPDNVGSACK